MEIDLYFHGSGVQNGLRVLCVHQAGFVRRLTPSEILDQVLFTQLDSGEPISNIVLMGIGEPLDNYESVLRFLELVNHPDGLNIGMRHIFAFDLRSGGANRTSRAAGSAADALFRSMRRTMKPAANCCLSIAPPVWRN